MYPVERFRLTGRVADHTLRSHKGTQVTRSFCPVCGSPVFSRNDGTPSHVAIAL